MKFFRRNSKGFTLIEIMIVVVIIGVLAALAIPRFMVADAKVKQTEAKLILKQLYTASEVYKLTHGVYYGDTTVTAGDTLVGLGVIIGESALYTYQLNANHAEFVAFANANIDDDATIDDWRITLGGELVNITDDSEE